MLNRRYKLGGTSKIGEGKCKFFLIFMGFVRGSPRNVLIAFSQSYVEHDLIKNKIVVPFFCLQINFYDLIVRF
jgi:hypothetical protein